MAFKNKNLNGLINSSMNIRLKTYCALKQNIILKTYCEQPEWRHYVNINFNVCLHNHNLLICATLSDLATSHEKSR